MGLPNVDRYPEATVTREDERLIINFGGCDYAQTMGVPLKYVNARDVETAELMLLASSSRSATAPGEDHRTPDPASEHHQTTLL
ncbi:MAG: hypothetical protein M3P92_12865 [Actinomycetota bacterium]|nr:hypothetical protein [Actinomycetota bacterium]